VLEDMIEKGDTPWRRNANHLKKPG
jgi:hypothetical protein